MTLALHSSGGDHRDDRVIVEVVAGAGAVAEIVSHEARAEVIIEDIGDTLIPVPLPRLWLKEPLRLRVVEEGDGAGAVVSDRDRGREGEDYLQEVPSPLLRAVA
jgi:hypothetical protein